MELSWKQKSLVVALMVLLFAGTVYGKQIWQGKQKATEEDLGMVPVTRMVEEESDLVETGESSEPVAESTETAEEKTPEEEWVVVDVEGAVVYPGVVKLPPGSRVYEAVEKAGGLLEKAETLRVNMAQKVSDGSSIYIPFEGEEVTGVEAGLSSESAAATTTQSNLVNINTADAATLMSLPGIGEVSAQAIIDYRETVGRFGEKVDLKKVSGIGDAKFAKIEGLITVE